MSTYFCLPSDFSSDNRATRHVRLACGFSRIFRRDEFSINEGATRQPTSSAQKSRAQSLRVGASSISVPFLRSLKSPRAFHEGNFALTSAQSARPLLRRRSSPIAISIFIYSRQHSELSNSRHERRSPNFRRIARDESMMHSA